MTTLTFESINYSPRRAAVRRSARPAPRAAAQQPLAIVTPRAAGDARAARNQAGLAALLVLTVGLHAAVIYELKQRGDIEPIPPQAPPLAIEFAPPPPPPPEPPKPIPHVPKVAPTPAAPPPQLPVVNQAPVDDGPPSADTVQVAQAAPPAPPVAAAPPAPEPVTEPRGYVGYRSNPPPEYPSLAQDRGWQGKVILRVHVLASGRADNIVVSTSTGHKVLDDSAIKTVLKIWVFEPARRGQTAIDGWVNIPLNFKLS